ncbi:MAG: DUF4231 domain-containing protein [Bacteroidia bacterium]
MNQDEYIEHRVEDQIKWYNNKASTNKLLFYISRGLTIVGGAVIPFLAGMVSPCNSWPLTLIAVTGVIIAIVTGIAAIAKFQEKWIEYRTISESLKHEKFLYLTMSGQYENLDKSFQIFVESIENYISKENSAWSNYINRNDA